jgi:hypothetical protein
VKLVVDHKLWYRWQSWIADRRRCEEHGRAHDAIWEINLMIVKMLLQLLLEDFPVSYWILLESDAQIAKEEEYLKKMRAQEQDA